MLGKARTLLILLLSISTVICDSPVEEKEEFVPAKFVVPTLSTKPHFFDFFGSTDLIGTRWIKSTAKKDVVDSDISKYNGEWKIDTPTEVSIEGDYGLIVTTKARHHAIAAKLDKPFVFEEAPLVVQYQVQFEEGQECGGGYMKLLSEGAEKDLSAVQDRTPYTIMFGPDKCGASGKVHLIFRYRNPKNGTVDEYHAKQPSNTPTSYWDDHKTHLYTLIVKPSGDFSVSVDQKSLLSGNMITDLVPSLTPPRQIPDPEDKKPEDWDERPEIADDSAVKPEDWDESQPKEVVDDAATKPTDWLEEEPALIADPEATRPEDWDEDMDGEWEAPLIDNPKCKGLSGCGQWKQPTKANPLFKGKWIRPKIVNPAYKGVWVPRNVDNPSYFEPTAFGGLSPISAIGIELWTMSSQIIFDNILITDSESTAEEVASRTYIIRRAEDERLATSKGNGSSVVDALLQAANERPWLWAVYFLCIAVPLVMLGIYLCGKRSQPSAPRRKTETFKDDDKIPQLVDDDEDEVEEVAEDIVEEAAEDIVEEAAEDIVEEAAEEKEPTPSVSRRSSRGSEGKVGSPKNSQKKTPSKAMLDIEDDEGSSVSSDVVEPEEVNAVPVEEKSAPTEETHEPESPKKPVTRRKTRRQD